MKYDVVIIGAGPGGIFSAYELVNKKKNLIIICEKIWYSDLRTESAFKAVSNEFLLKYHS